MSYNINVASSTWKKLKAAAVFSSLSISKMLTAVIEQSKLIETILKENRDIKK